MNLDELNSYLEEIGFTETQMTEALMKADLTERWVMVCQRGGDAIKNRGGFVWKGIQGGQPPSEPRPWKQGDGPKPKETPEVSHESLLAIADAHMSMMRDAFFADYDDEAVRPEERKKGGVFVKKNAMTEIRWLEGKYKQTFEEDEVERLLKRAQMYAKEALEAEREATKRGRALNRHRRLELIGEGKDPNRFWGGATEEELDAWNRRHSDTLPDGASD